MGCGFPAVLVSRVILRSVRRARTAFWQFSRFPRRPRHRIDPENHPPAYTQTIRSGRHPHSRSRGRPTRFSRSIAQVHHDSLACTRSSLYPQTRRNLQTIPTRREGHLTRTAHSIAAILPPVMAIHRTLLKT